RRHTRFSRDWSSDVCSSDLFRLERVTRIDIGKAVITDDLPIGPTRNHPAFDAGPLECAAEDIDDAPQAVRNLADYRGIGDLGAEIGRASCRERAADGVDVRR